MDKWKKISIILLVVIVAEAVLIYALTPHVERGGVVINSVVSNPSKSTPNSTVMAASGAVYRQNPISGNYSFIIRSGTAFDNLSNRTLVISYAYLNLTEVEPGDEFRVFVPINVGSQVMEAFYANPIINITILNSTVYSAYGQEYLNFTIRADIPVYNEATGGGTTVALGHEMGLTSVTPLGYGTDLYIGFISFNTTVLELEFYIAPGR